MRTIQQIHDEMSQVRERLTALADLNRALDETESTTWTADNTRWDELVVEEAACVERNTRLDAIRGADLTHTVTGDGARAAGDTFQVQRTAPENIYDLAEIHHSRTSPEWGQEVRDRAMRSIDTWADEYGLDASYQESAASLVRNASRSQRDRDVANYLLATGSPEYFRAFAKVLANPQAGHMNFTPEEATAFRAALNEGTTTQGGFAVPPFLDPTLILQNAGISSPWRSICTVKTITTETWKGLTSGGVTAEWTAEAAEAADASPTFGQPSITPVRADAYVQASFELILDTNIATDLATLFADAKDRLEGTAFAVGTGSTQPKGIVTALTGITASKVAATTNGSFGAVDVFAVDNAMSQRYRGNASWVANKSIYNLARLFATGSGMQSGSFWVDFGGGRPSSLIGYPVYEASAMASSVTTATTNFIAVLGDFKQYYIVDRVGMSVAYNPLVIGTNRRPTGEAGWFAYWRVGGDCVNVDAFRMEQG